MNSRVQSLDTAPTGSVSQALFSAWPYHPRMLQVLTDAWDDVLGLSSSLSFVRDEGAVLVAPREGGFDLSLGGRRIPMAAGQRVRELLDQAKREGGHLRLLVPLDAQWEDAAWATVMKGGREILSWERRPERGPLHDPPTRWQPIVPEVYWRLHANWARAETVWPRERSILRRLNAHLPLHAYAVAARDHELVAAMLLWMPGPDFVHVLDVIWHPQRGIRSSGRYLLQELYMHVPGAHVYLDLEDAESPLNRVLAALGYRVYRRWMSVDV